jgi:hypothetical protein
MVIKSTWLPCELHDHELNVLRRIASNRSESNKHFHIPIPIGKIVSGKTSKNRKQKPGSSRMLTIADLAPANSFAAESIALHFTSSYIVDI